MLVLVVLFCDSDRVGRGERSRASDACEMRMRLLAWTERISYAEALPCSAAENSSPLSLRLYIRYGSSISISIDLSDSRHIGSNSSSSGRRKSGFPPGCAPAWRPGWARRGLARACRRQVDAAVDAAGVASTNAARSGSRATVASSASLAARWRLRVVIIASERSRR